MVKALIRLRNLARQSFLLMQLRALYGGHDPRGFFVSKGTDICIEGYPRSANSFAVRMFRKANDVRIGHHTHSTGNIARALSYGIPVVVLIRDPVDAIVSSVIAVSRDGDISQLVIDDRVCYYLTFYRWIERRAESVVLVSFDLVVSDFNRVIEQVNDKYGATFNRIEDINAMADQVQQDIRSRYERLEQSKMSMRPIPTPRRESLKKEIHPLVSNHQDIDRAQALYSRLVSISATVAGQPNDS